MCLQLPLEASTALSALAMAPGLPNPFPEVREPFVSPIYFVSLEATASLRNPVSHPHTIPAAHE